MSISSIQLDAFLALIQEGSFTAAAKHLHITQSALSQRIHNLEQDLETSFIQRQDKSFDLSEAGKQLFHYCLQRKELERDLVTALEGHGDMAGEFSIGAVSTVALFLVLPRIAKLQRNYPRLSVNLATGTQAQLLSGLKSGSYQYIYTNQAIYEPRLESTITGHEDYVLVEQDELEQSRKTTYLDIDEGDDTTIAYLAKQNEKASIDKRLFYNNIYVLMEAAKLGLGRAVLPIQMLDGQDSLKRVPHQSSLKLPIYLVTTKKKYETKIERLLKTYLGKIFTKPS